jgi:cytochrome c551/c552
MMNRRAFLALCPLMIAGPSLAADPGRLTLLMFEQPGCVYCARWNAEVGPEYAKTAEGKLAPLQRVQLADGAPVGVTLVSKPVFTPTFVLIRDGAELGRIEGYPGEDFFWGLLGALLRDAKATPD